MLEYDFNYLRKYPYGVKIPINEPSKIVINNEAAIAISKCNKDTIGALPGDIIMYTITQPLKSISLDRLGPSFN